MNYVLNTAGTKCILKTNCLSGSVIGVNADGKY